jgi:membrane protein implicated in regulation of membrane protease activity
MTMEMLFALFAGAILAGAAYFGVTAFLPNVVGSLRDQEGLIGPLALAVTAVVFIVVVSIVLTRFRRATRLRRQAAGPPGGHRAPRPGRTSPDS